MKKKFKICMVTLIGAGLMLPFFQASALQEFAQPSNAAETEAVNGQAPQVQVAMLTVTGLTEVKIRTQSTDGLSGCASLSQAQNNLVQGSSMVNLNQPASCFTITLGHAATVARLAVEPLAANNFDVKVVANAPVISSPSLAQAPLGTASQALPAAFTVSVILMAVSVRRQFAKLAITLKQNTKSPLTLNQLQILRC